MAVSTGLLELTVRLAPAQISYAVAPASTYVLFTRMFNGFWPLSAITGRATSTVPGTVAKFVALPKALLTTTV